jgi:hypothetical protein
MRAAVLQSVLLSLVLLARPPAFEIASADDSSQCTVRNSRIPAQGRQTGVIRTIAGVAGIAFIVEDGAIKRTIPITAGQSFLSGIPRLKDGLRVSYAEGLDEHCLIWISDVQVM